MKSLLIQIREDEATRKHEIDCFVRRSGIDAKKLISIDSLKTLPKSDLLEDADVLVVGGSGDYLISEGDVPEQIAAIGEVLTAAREKQIPTLAICFGAQIMAHVFGGKVEKDVSRQELGTYEIEKSSMAEHCPIFKDLPESFHVQLGHKDHITALPNGAIHLASSERSEVQAFTFPGEKVYAYTFHPELDAEDIRWRLDYYAKNYGLTKETINSIMSRTFSAQHGTRPLRAFYKEVAGKGLNYGLVKKSMNTSVGVLDSALKQGI